MNTPNEIIEHLETIVRLAKIRGRDYAVAHYALAQVLNESGVETTIVSRNTRLSVEDHRSGSSRFVKEQNQFALKIGNDMYCLRLGMIPCSWADVLLETHHRLAKETPVDETNTNLKSTFISLENQRSNPPATLEPAVAKARKSIKAIIYDRESWINQDSKAKDFDRPLDDFSSSQNPISPEAQHYQNAFLDKVDQYLNSISTTSVSLDTLEKFASIATQNTPAKALATNQVKTLHAGALIEAIQAHIISHDSHSIPLQRNGSWHNLTITQGPAVDQDEFMDGLLIGQFKPIETSRGNSGNPFNQAIRSNYEALLLEMNTLAVDASTKKAPRL